jgi:hypothetical protein
MKKIALASVLFAAIAFAGCLKDKGFDNHEYGINDPDTQPPGVGFTFGYKAKNDYGLDVSASAQIINNLLVIKILAGTPPASDVTVTLTNTTAAQVAAYNAANGTSIQALPTAILNIPLSIVIPAGAMDVKLPITVSNTTALNPNVQYALGLTIASATSGYTIADNFKNLFIVFGVKNAYDGKYSIRGKFYHPSYPFYPFASNVEMQTTGPSSNIMYWPLAGDFGAPFSTSPSGSSLSYFGSQWPQFTVNTSTNKVTVDNVYPGAVTFYAMGKGFDNAGYNSRWDPATKTFFVCYGYNLGAAGDFILGTSRMWMDTLVRTGPR